MNWYVHVLKNYARFSGRARRQEYWMFFLLNMIVAFVIGLIGGLLGVNALGSIYSLAVFLPSVAVGVRRMHDTDHSGWWILFPFVNLYLALKPGDSGENRHGPDPKDDSSEIDQRPLV
jgi:uncharacterized membrane protein YhaH (DUF805 family)